MSENPFGKPTSINAIAFETGRIAERVKIIDEIERNICFDAQADADGRCSHHGGKCYELRLLINKLRIGGHDRV